MRFFITLALATAVAPAAPGEAKVIGWMTPAEPVTEARISALAEGEQHDWRIYLARSRASLQADKKVLADERVGLATLPPSPKPGSPRSMPLDRPDAWYASDEARRIAENILSFQTPSGGWSKNQDRSALPRVRGQSFAVTQDPRIAALPGANEPPWTYVGTIDNGATHSEMRFLARIQAHVPTIEGDRYRASFLKGLDYLLASQFPNGGWPQIYPLQGGYHDAITFNDDALVEVAKLLSDVARNQNNFAFVSAERAAAARAAVDLTNRLVLRTQVVVDGKPTIWAQQYDALTLAPVGARNFEPAALASDESVGLAQYLGKVAADNVDAAAAVQFAREWLDSHAIEKKTWDVAAGDEGRTLRDEAGAKPIWSRYYDIADGRPIFGDRDRSIHDDVNEVSVERRNGYSWFNRRACKLTGRCGPVP